MQNHFYEENVEALEKLGRWICWSYYRDMPSFHNEPFLCEIIESACRQKRAWADLLCGCMRPQDNMRRMSFYLGQKANYVKYGRLGPVVKPWQSSIDGHGLVREKEVELYIFVAMEFVTRGGVEKILGEAVKESIGSFRLSDKFY